MTAIAHQMFPVFMLAAMGGMLACLFLLGGRLAVVAMQGRDLLDATFPRPIALSAVASFGMALVSVALGFMCLVVM